MVNRMPIMKNYSVFLISIIAILCWSQNGLADRLHHWVDSKGVTHLSKEPPPQDGKLIEIMEYSTRTDAPEPSSPGASAGGLKKQKERAVETTPRDAGNQTASDKDLASICYIYANGEDVFVFVTEREPMTGPQDINLFRGTISKKPEAADQKLVWQHHIYLPSLSRRPQLWRQSVGLRKRQCGFHSLKSGADRNCGIFVQ